MLQSYIKGLLDGGIKRHDSKQTTKNRTHKLYIKWGTVPEVERGGGGGGAALLFLIRM